MEPKKPVKQYEAKYTPLSRSAARMALEEAVLAIVGHTLSKSAMCVLMAQSALKTGGFQKMANFNWGGIKYSPGYDFASWKTTEGFGDTETRIVAKFRAYPDAVTGAKDFVRFLANSPRYAKAWKELEAGDPIKYAFALGAAGYFTADPTQYAKGVAREWAWCGLDMMSYGHTPEEVKRFQKAHPEAGNADGLLGPMTRKAIKNALGD